MSEDERTAVAVATVRELARRAGAERVVLLIDEGEAAEATMIEWAMGSPVELTQAGVTRTLGAEAVPGAAPAGLPDVRPVPATAIAVDPELGELAAPIGVVAGLAEAVLALATAFGGRSVATAEFATRDAEHPLILAARPGEPIVASVGGQHFAFPDGWP